MELIIYILIVVALYYYYKKKKKKKPQKFSIVKKEDKYHTLYILGDLHGDLEKTKEALKKVGLINENNQWIKSNCKLIQMGDQVDSVCRRKEKNICNSINNLDVEVIYFIEEMARQAEKLDSKVVSILGNHEIMNIQGDLRFVSANDIKRIGGTEERIKLFKPGSELCKLLSNRPLIYKYNGFLFCHGGLSMSMLEKNSIEQMNQKTKKWLLNEISEPGFLRNEDSPIWSRKFAFNMGSENELQQILKLTNSNKMFVGHTVSDSIESKYNGKFWVTDVGISSSFPGNKIELIEVNLKNNNLNIIK
jgi:hypothetical protein